MIHPGNGGECARDRCDRQRLGVWRKYPALRLAVYAATTVTAAALALFVWMPPGFAGVGYAGLVFFAYLYVFLTMALAERSVWVNAAVGPIFFASLLLIKGHFQPEAMRTLAIVAAVHALIQGGFAAVVHQPWRESVEEA